MKKSLFVLGMAVAALASCTNEEVVSVPQSNTIAFSSFVNNATKADATVTTDNLTAFNVFGQYGTTSVFTNAPFTGKGQSWTGEVAYWVANETYRFGAYSDGNGSLADAGVTFNFGTSNNASLTFNDYSAKDADLVAALSGDETRADLSTTPAKVNLTFKHMLSKVKFTFKTTDNHDLTFKVTDLKIGSQSDAETGAAVTGNGTISGNGATATIDWTEGATTGSYNYKTGTNDVISDFAVPTGTASVEKIVIPQTNSSLYATFTVTGTDGGSITETKTFVASLNYTHDGSAEWKAGYIYDYTATITLNDLIGEDDDPYQKIEFAVTSVDKWKTETASDDLVQ